MNVFESYERMMMQREDVREVEIKESEAMLREDARAVCNRKWEQRYMSWMALRRWRCEQAEQRWRRLRPESWQHTLKARKQHRERKLQIEDEEQ